MEAPLSYDLVNPEIVRIKIREMVEGQLRFEIRRHNLSESAYLIDVLVVKSGYIGIVVPIFTYPVMRRMKMKHFPFYCYYCPLNF